VDVGAFSSILFEIATGLDTLRGSARGDWWRAARAPLSAFFFQMSELYLKTPGVGLTKLRNLDGPVDKMEES
jgi:hypothetical protein